LPCTTTRCVLDAVLASPACEGQTIPPGLTGKLTTAESLIDQAATTPDKKARQILQKAKRFLRQAGVKADHAAKGKKATISEACAAAIEAALKSVRGGLTPPGR